MTKNGTDPDFRRYDFHIDTEPLIGKSTRNMVVVVLTSLLVSLGQISERIKAEEVGSGKQMNKKLEEALTAKQEAEAKVAQLEAKLQEAEKVG